MNKVVNRKRMAMVAYVFYALICWYAFRMNNVMFVIPFILVYPLLEVILPTVFFTICPQTGDKPEYAGVALGIF